MRSLALLLVLLSTNVRAQGLLGTPGGLLADPKAVAFEDAFQAEINKRREKKGLGAFIADARLRGFMRGEAALAAKGDPTAAKIVDRIKGQGMAPYGYFFQFSFGTQAAAVLSEMEKDAAFAKALYGEFARAGVGVFMAQGEKGPQFQVGVMFAADPDPMAGKSGLSQAQTDPVMNGALTQIKKCYDEVLKADPNAGGDLLVKVVIGGEGTVTEAGMLKSLGKPAFDDCALTVVRGLSFPKPYKGKPVTLNHPMRFTPPTGGRRIGKLTQSQIDTAFRAASYDFKVCYDARAKLKPTLGGSIELALTVMPNGATDKLRVQKDTIEDPELTNCIMTRAKDVRFPAPDLGGEVDLVYPLNFAPYKK
jgi:TonB family protein